MLEKINNAGLRKKSVIEPLLRFKPNIAKQIKKKNFNTLCVCVSKVEKFIEIEKCNVGK